MRFLIAFDKFKHSFEAQEANEIASDIIRKKVIDAKIVSFPISDGGEGFVNFISRIKNLPIGQIQAKSYTGKKILVDYLLDSHGNLYVAYSSICGLDLDGTFDIDLRERTSATFADYLHQLMELLKPSALIIGIGGSGTQDFGEGFYYRAQALELPDIPVRVVSDVRTNLKNIFIYGPQKGMEVKDILEWEKRRAQMLHSLIGKDISEEPFYGASGGILMGLKAYYSQVDVQLGSETLQKEIQKFGEFDYFITGEGKLDHTSKQGKGAYALATNLKNYKKCLFFCGVDSLFEKTSHIEIIEIAETKNSLEQNLAQGRELLAKQITQYFS